MRTIIDSKWRAADREEKNGEQERPLAACNPAEKTEWVRGGGVYILCRGAILGLA